MAMTRIMDAPPSYTGQDVTKFNTLPSLLSLCRQQNISPFFASQLHILQEYVSIRFILDDSGSMRTTELDEYGRVSGSRWDELLRTLSMAFDMASAASISKGGNGVETSMTEVHTGHTIDIHLLNGHADGRKQFLGLKTFKELESHLVGLPIRGKTPTLECIQDLMHYERMQSIGELPVLTILMTDGQPDCGIPKFARFLQETQLQYANHFITIALCTGDDSVVSMYNSLDTGIPRVDVMDDYISERQEILGIQGRKFPFSRSDYLVKMLLGSRVSLWDALDEKKLNKAQRKLFEDYSAANFGGSRKKGGGGCVIS